MAEPDSTSRQQPPNDEQRGAGDVTKVAVDLATIYGIYKATHPPKDPPTGKK